MELIIDANILFSVLIKKGKTEELILNQDLELYAPEYLFEEFLKYKDLILAKTYRNERDFNEIITILMKKITTIPVEKTYLLKAKHIIMDINDIEYVALALQRKCAVWSNDKALARQDVVKVYSTTELLSKFT
jgi:predicted nucleic acid-binding protein